VGCALLLAGALIQARATTETPTNKTASSATKSTPHPAGSAKSAKKHSSSQKGKHSKKTASWRKRGQQKIDGQRAQEIQEALIREHYLKGKASGVWDAASQTAMERYQADNGWQSKMIPDSRALIKLGLGPDHQHLLNPESAMTTAPTPGNAKDATNSSPPQR
jgi:putative peptidoglycan binding protein